MQCRDRRLLRFGAAPQRSDLAASTAARSRSSATKNPFRHAMSGSDMQARTHGAVLIARSLPGRLPHSLREDIRRVGL